MAEMNSTYLNSQLWQCKKTRQSTNVRYGTGFFFFVGPLTLTTHHNLVVFTQTNLWDPLTYDFLSKKSSTIKLKLDTIPKVDQMDSYKKSSFS